MDFNNNVLLFPPRVLVDCQIQKLQSKQNTAARLMTGIKKYDHLHIRRAALASCTPKN